MKKKCTKKKLTAEQKAAQLKKRKVLAFRKKIRSSFTDAGFTYFSTLDKHFPIGTRTVELDYLFFRAVITTLNIAQKLLPFFSVPAYYGRFLGLFVLLAISWRTFLAHDRRKMRFICYISRNFLSTHSAAFPARKDNSKSRIRHRNHLRKVRCPPASWLPSFAARIQRRNEFANGFPQVRLTGS